MNKDEDVKYKEQESVTMKKSAGELTIDGDSTSANFPPLSSTLPNWASCVFQGRNLGG